MIVEDSVAGVTAAVAAGIPVLGFLGGSHCDEALEQRLLSAGASSTFHHMRDLPAKLEALGSTNDA